MNRHRTAPARVGPVAVAAIALALAFPAGAQLYKWVDKDGKTSYSDTPPPNQETKMISPGGTAAAAPAAPAKTAVARDKELEKGRTDSREASKKSDDTAKLAAQKEEACTRAKGAYQTYADGGRIHKYNAQGEREFLGDDEIAAERERTRREMDEACKKS